MQLRIRTPGGRVFEIPIVEKHPYLGVVITYGDVVQLTAQHRTQLAWTAWGRLRPLLTSAQAPSPETSPPTVARLHTPYTPLRDGLCADHG